NRTLVCSLGSCRSTIELRPRASVSSAFAGMGRMRWQFEHTGSLFSISLRPLLPSCVSDPPAAPTTREPRSIASQGIELNEKDCLIGFEMRGIGGHKGREC